MRFRLVTYNIHKGIGGVDRLYRPERIIETLALCAPDIVLLQEVAEGVPRWHHDRQVHLIGDALEFRYRAFQPNARLRKGHYGNAILSHFPLSDIHDIELTVPLKKRRRALGARCHVHSSQHSYTVLLFNFHLGLAAFERAIQVRRFLSGHALERVRHSTAVVAAGDFNDMWETLGKRQFEQAGFKLASGRSNTFPAFRPVRPLDAIYIRGNLTVVDSFRYQGPAAKKASDHLPVVADFQLP
ncbi:MAG: hypothetical protein GTO40_20535 [Deltaproteobacteria bacterium]|nr:hypothetical protein [Deltaproteobacteria bacterium]